MKGRIKKNQIHKKIQDKSNNQENENKIWKKLKMKIMDSMMKLKINWDLIKGLRIKLRNQNVENQI